MSEWTLEQAKEEIETVGEFEVRRRLMRPQTHYNAQKSTMLQAALDAQERSLKEASRAEQAEIARSAKDAAWEAAKAAREANQHATSANAIAALALIVAIIAIGVSTCEGTSASPKTKASAVSSPSPQASAP